MTKKHLLITGVLAFAIGGGGGYLAGYQVAATTLEQKYDQYLKSFIIGSAAIQQQKEHEERVSEHHKRMQEFDRSFEESRNRIMNSFPTRSANRQVPQKRSN